MLDNAETRSAVLSILSDIAPEIESDADFDVTTNLREQVDLDSMDFLNLIETLSERFKIDIPQKDYSQLVSFNDIVEYTQRKSEGPRLPDT